MIPHPFKVIIPGGHVSLKNSWVIKRGKTPKEDKLYHPASVHRAMNNIRAAIQRQLPGDFTIIETGIAVVLECHIAYKSLFPKSDLDNFATTIQECLQETVIENDRQVEALFVYRKRAKSKLSQHTLLYFWETKDIIEELPLFIEWRNHFESRPTLSNP